MRDKIKASDLQIGMFVIELDRPWLETPFMLQGFLIEKKSQISKIQELCQEVTIDYARSSGEYYKPENSNNQEKTSVLKEQAVTASENEKQSSKQNTQQKKSFYEIIKELKTKSPNNPPLQTTPEQIKASPSKNTITTDAANKIDKTDTAQRSVKAGQSGFLEKSLTGLRHLLSKKGVPATPTSSAVETSSDISPEAFLTDGRIPVEEELVAAYPVFENAQLATQEIFAAMRENRQMDMFHVNQALDEMMSSIERNSDALIWLAKLKRTDDYAYNHALNVSITLMALGHFMALPKSQIRDLGTAGLLQDVGKINIPAEILKKSGPLDDAERVLVNTHVKLGLDTLKQNIVVTDKVLEIIAQHHERYDGSGYPFKLKGKQISLPSQMAGLVDTYCAITSDKPYAKGMHSQRALEVLYGMREKDFSDALVNQLIQFLGIYPVGSLVELNTAEVGVVIQQNNIRRLLPRVMIILAPDKTRNEFPTTIDLLLAPKTPEGEPYQIVRGIDPDSYGLNLADFYV